MSDTSDNEQTYDSIVRPLFLEGLNKPRTHRRSGAMRLYPSEAGGCNRRTMLRMNHAPSKPFPLQVLEAMNNGNAYEDSTYEALVAAVGEDRITTQLQLQSPHWSGKCDFVLDHKTEKAIIIEHKATGQKWFDYKASLPKRDHVVQVALYETLYKKQFGFKPKLLLYYRAWGCWAEFHIQPREADILIVGAVNGVYRERVLPVNMTAAIRRLEYLKTKNKIPGRVDEAAMEETGCTFRGEPSCGFYGLCWPKEATPQGIKEIATE